jgi:hypothetical protein
MVGCTVLSGECRGFEVHPARCPARAATPVEKKFLRRGKALILPREAGYVLVSGVDDAEAVMFVVDGADQDAFMAHVHTQKKYGRLGRIDVLRYHPFASSTNPCGQVLLRCNWDVQCMDRVFVFDGVVGEAGVAEAIVDGAGALDEVVSGAPVRLRSCGHCCVSQGGVGGEGFLLHYAGFAWFSLLWCCVTEGMCAAVCGVATLDLAGTASQLQRR